VVARARYSASVEDLEIVPYFLDLQDTREEPRKMQNPVVDFLVSRHVPQSESLNAFSCILLSAGKNKPYEGLAFMYLKTC